MKEEIAKRVVDHLNKFPIGFPKAFNNDEWKMLDMANVITDEEGELMTKLMPYPEHIDAIARRTGMGKEILLRLLEGLMHKCWVVRDGSKEDGKYLLDAWGPGTYERQGRYFTTEYMQYIGNLGTQETLERIYGRPGMTPTYRVIPVGDSVSTDSRAIPADHFKMIVEGADAIAVTDCVCRSKVKILAGAHCGKPTEGVCMYFGPYAKTMVEIGVARAVDKEEALRIGKMCEDAGLIHTATTSEAPMFVCNCCNCCCDNLLPLKMGLDYTLGKASVYAEIDGEQCTGCEECVAACFFGAIAMNHNDGKAVLTVGKCFGCGQCVKSCPIDAISLTKRDEVVDPPRTWQDFLRLRAKETGNDEFFR